jgi:hypothetical protein
LRHFIEAEATATQTPHDLAAMLALSVVAAAAARYFRIEVKEGWSEPLNIFTVTVLPPAARKSAVFSHVTAPLVAYEQELARRAAPDIAAARNQFEIASKRLSQAQKQAASDPGHEGEAERLAREHDGLRIPAAPRLIADDATPEKICALLYEQRGRLAVMSPEGGVFDLMAGRYSQHGAPNFEVFLKGHAGDTLRIDRMSRSEHVERPALTLGLAVQPKVLEGLMAVPGFRGKGLLGRFLYCIPPNLIGKRRVDAPAVPAPVTNSYAACITCLLGLAGSEANENESQERLLRPSDEARAVLREAEKWIEPQLMEFGELGGLQDWAGKWLGAVARIAGLLHLTCAFGEAEPWNTPVSKATVEHALAIGRYLIPHAKAAFAAMGADPSVEDAKYILRSIEHRGLKSFTKRDLFEGTKGRFRQVSLMEPGLRVLEQHLYVRQRPEDDIPHRGRPASPHYDVNPDVYSHNSQNDPAADRLGNIANCANENEKPVVPHSPVHGVFE